MIQRQEEFLLTTKCSGITCSGWSGTQETFLMDWKCVQGKFLPPA